MCEFAYGQGVVRPGVLFPLCVMRYGGLTTNRGLSIRSRADAIMLSGKWELGRDIA